MKLKKIAAWAAAAVMTLSVFASCGTSIIKNEKVKKNNDSSSIASIEADTKLDSQPDTVSNDTAQYTETNFEAIEVPYVEYKKTYQAETGTLSGDKASVLKERADFRGDGYVSGADKGSWSLSFDLPESQFYNITAQVASDKAVNCRLFINGSEVWIFRASGSGQFEEKKLENIWLQEGINEITVQSTDDAVDIDFITIQSNEEISSLNPDLSAAALSNPKASYQAKALYSILCSNYGRQVITAQHDSEGDSATTELVKKITDKYPAIRFSEIGGYTRKNTKEISQAKKYAASGGLIGYDWYWLDPMGSDTFEIADCNFDITKAKPEMVAPEPEQNAETDDTSSLNEDQQSAGSQAAELASQSVTAEKVLKISVEEMANWSEDEAKAAFDNGDITKECYALIKDIDTVSAKLAVLKKEKVPVLWRPLPVASNGLYWWGLDKESYIWLWQLMYTRMTQYHKLNNLVWVWSAQNADWYVGDEYCDVLAADIYTDGNRDAQINTLLFLNNICKTKPLAMSECGNLPAMESILQEKAFWSFTALWGEPYFSAETGIAIDDSETAAALEARFKEYYNNNYTITLEELPSLGDVAKSIKQAEKGGKDEKDKTEKDSDKKSDSKADTASDDTESKSDKKKSESDKTESKSDDTDSKSDKKKSKNDSE